jgi:hypothetical protein
VQETDPSKTLDEETDQSHPADPSEPGEVPTELPTGDENPEDGPGDATPR